MTWSVIPCVRTSLIHDIDIRSQWIIIDAKVYDVTRFKNLHPGGISVFYEEDIGSSGFHNRAHSRNLRRCSAGQDATEAFYGLHRHEVLLKPQYQRLQIGVIKDEKSVVHSNIPGELSNVPYAEPLGLTPGYHSPYYTEVNHMSRGRDGAHAHPLCNLPEPPQVPARVAQVRG